MPFMEIWRPSIQLGLLSAVAGQRGFAVRTLHANLDFAQQIGAGLYTELAEFRRPLLGEWLFSREAFGEAAPDRSGTFLDCFSDLLSCLNGPDREWRRLLLSIRDEMVPGYLDRLVATYPWDQATIIGFTSSFQQNTASIALARRLKSQHPDVTVVFGGANFEDEMGLELVRAVDPIDYAVIGEGDAAFPRLLDALVSGSDVGEIPGVAYRRDGEVLFTPPDPHLTQMDNLPPPDYDEYFEHAEELGLLSRVDRPSVWLPIETSRGCWWGAKHHCTFCGLNGTTMRFRSKSVAQVVHELNTQATRYRTFRFEGVDNILDATYVRDLFPLLSESGADYQLFYEAKANLTRRQLKTMADAGVSRIQPGIESLSSHVLELMRKGVRPAQNVNLLRWCRYYGIEVEWNILWGFPGETLVDYAEQAGVVQHLVHLQPPAAASRIWLERFSPLYSDPDLFPMKYCRPERSYQYIYPDRMDLRKVAYFFDYETQQALPDNAYHELIQAINAWTALWEKDKQPSLTYWYSPGIVQIYDARHEGEEGTYNFEGTLAAIYHACSDRPISAAAVRDKTGLQASEEAIQAIFTEFARRGLMLLDGRSALSLALPAVTGR